MLLENVPQTIQQKKKTAYRANSLETWTLISGEFKKLWQD